MEEPSIEASNSNGEASISIRGGRDRADGRGHNPDSDAVAALTYSEERRDDSTPASILPPVPTAHGDDPAADDEVESGRGGKDNGHIHLHRRYASFAPEILRLGDDGGGGEEEFRETRDARMRRNGGFDRSRTEPDATQLLRHRRRNGAMDGDATTTSIGTTTTSVRVSPIENQDGVRREQVAEVREEDEAVPMSPLARRTLQLRHLLCCYDLGFRFGKRRSGDTTGSGGDDDDSSCCFSAEDDEKEKQSKDEGRKKKQKKRKKQYRITSKQTTVSSRSTNAQYGRCIMTALGLAYDPESDILVNGPILAYVSWSFRASFLATFCSMLIVFMTWVVFFAGWLALAGYLKPDCVYVSGEEYYDSGKAGSFADLFQLSWTTFSTVGYGSVFPSTSVQTQSQLHCSFVQFLCTVEAFVGVLYAGFCGAILFGKVSRVQSNARVMFSDPLCVRYGHDGVGCVTEEERDEEEEEGDTNDRDNDERNDGSDDDDLETGGAQKSEKTYRKAEETSSNIPCPLLEFRVINERSNFFGGAIMDASLSCVASMITALNNRGELLVSTSSSIGDDSGSLYADQRYSMRSRGSGRTNSMGSTEKGGGNRGSAARKMFKPVELEASNHPFFQRVWNARHVLDADSPLLRDRVRRMIRANGGYWPPELNSAQGVRGSLRFSQIIVSFSGVSQISAQSVYAQKIYDFVDINVGYRFAPVLYQNKDSNKLSVDMTMINDIEEQNGGGGEPLCCGDEDDNHV